MTRRRSLPALLLLTAALLSSCSGSDAGHQARALIAVADSSARAGAYADALRLLDSAAALAPADLEVLRQSRSMSDSILLVEAHEQLVACDRELLALRAEAAELSQHFVKQRSEVYDTPLKFVHPQLTPEKLGARPHLRMQVSPDGDVTFVSVYAGAHPVEHSALRATRPSSEGEVTSPSVPLDGALNYRYSDGLRHWELVSYPRETCDSLASLLAPALLAGEVPVIELLHQGRVACRLSFSPSDLRAMTETLALHLSLKRLSGLETRRSVCLQRVERLSK